MERVDLKIEDSGGYNIRAAVVGFLSLMFFITIGPNFIVEYSNPNIPQIYDGLLIIVTFGWIVTAIVISMFVCKNIVLRVIIVLLCVFYVITGGSVCLFEITDKNYCGMLFYESVVIMTLALVTILLYTKWRPKPSLAINSDSITVKRLRKKGVHPILWTSVKEVDCGRYDNDDITVTTDTGTYFIWNSELRGYSEEEGKISSKQTIMYLKELCEKKGINCMGYIPQYRHPKLLVF
jgi:hypothetical protein